MRPDVENGGLYLENEAEVLFVQSALRAQHADPAVGGETRQAESRAIDFFEDLEIKLGNHDLYLNQQLGEAVLVALGYTAHWHKDELARKMAQAMKSEYFQPLRRKNRHPWKLVN